MEFKSYGKNSSKCKITLLSNEQTFWKQTTNILGYC